MIKLDYIWLDGYALNDSIKSESGSFADNNKITYCNATALTTISG